MTSAPRAPLGNSTSPTPTTFLLHTNPRPLRYYSFVASSARWFATFLAPYALEFLCLIVPKLMLLARLTSTATRGAQPPQAMNVSSGRRAWHGALPRLYRVFAAAVVTLSVAGMVAVDVSAAYEVRGADVADQASAACDVHGNDTNTSLALFTQSNAILNQARTFLSIQSAFESATLLVVCLAFVVLVVLCIALFRGAERVAAHALLAANRSDAQPNARRSEAAVAIVDDTMRFAAEQRQRLSAACCVVAITFPARIAFDCLQSFAYFNESYNLTCAICDPCQTEQYLIRTYLIYTPEFWPLVVVFSSPLPLVLSLWLITKAHAQAYGISLKLLRARLGKTFGGSRASDNRQRLDV